MTATPKMPGRRKWDDLVKRLANGEADIGVIGLGYVGLPVAVELTKRGFMVLGVDNSHDRIAAIRGERSHLIDVPDGELTQALRARRLSVSTSYRSLRNADAILVCVPTPLKEGAPDLSYVQAAGDQLARVLSPGKLVVLESTTFPGTTDDLLRPLLESNGLVAGRDFLLAYSPERIDPGNRNYSFPDIPKVVGGINEDSTRAAQTLYEQVVSKVVTVSSPREAEMAKLIENTYRHVNIALINELAIYAYELKIDIWEAIEAAATKPFGYEPFWPSPGWGGHCIPLDPTYLSYSVRKHRAHDIHFVELAQSVNSEMPRHVSERVSLMLNERGQSVRGSRILALGVAYKGGTEDTRHSPGIRVLDMLAARGARVSYHDPLVPEVQIATRSYRSVALTKRRVRDADLVVALVKQEGVDWDLVADAGSLVFDCCRAFQTHTEGVRRL